MDVTILTDSLRGLVPFLIYVGLSLAMLAIYVAVYTVATQHDEMALIRADNRSAAVAFAGSMIGYGLPLASAAIASRAILEFLVWGVIGILVQILIYWVFRLVLLPDMSARIDRGELAAGIFLGAASLTGGIVNAAAMAI